MAVERAKMRRDVKGWGKRRVKCPGCGRVFRVFFRTLHKLQVQVEEGGKGVGVFHSKEEAEG